MLNIERTSNSHKITIKKEARSHGSHWKGYNRCSESTKIYKDARFEVMHNKVILKNDATPNELLDIFHSLDNQKHPVAEQVQNAL